MGLDILLYNNDNTNKYIVIYSKLVYQITHKSHKMLQNVFGTHAIFLKSNFQIATRPRVMIRFQPNLLRRCASRLIHIFLHLHDGFGEYTLHILMC